IAAPAAIGNMKMLEVLSLANCKLLDLPQEIGELTNIRLLDLEDCHHSRKKLDAIFPPNVISRWSRLEELYSSSFMKYTREHIAELKSLSHLTTLIMEVPDFGCIPEGFSFPELEVFKIAIRGSVHHKQSNYLEVCGWVNAKKFFAIPSLGCVKPLLKRTQYLQLSSFEGLRTIFPYQLADRDGLAVLKTLEVSDCVDLEYLIDSEEWKMPPVIEQHQHTCLMHLEKLDLQCLGSFKGLCHGALPAELSMSLQKLKSMRFFKCVKLSSVFASLELLQRFDELEELSVDSCEALDLPFKWPSLENVEVRQCPKMETLAAIVDSEENQSTPKLKQIKLDGVDLILHGRSLNKFIQKYSEARELRNLINDHQSRMQGLTES
ncbi:hypothetical protein H0E87_011615, partial [Populus deltoides]